MLLLFSLCHKDKVATRLDLRALEEVVDNTLELTEEKKDVCTLKRLLRFLAPRVT